MISVQEKEKAEWAQYDHEIYNFKVNKSENRSLVSAMIGFVGFPM